MTDAWISSLSAIAALITAIVALATVLEMRRQRRSAYRPDFALLQCPVYGYRDQKGRIHVSSSPEKPELIRAPSFTIPAVNVGLGCCKNLKLRWVYDVPEFIRIIGLSDSTESSEITYENRLLSIREKEAFLSETHNLSVQNSSQLPYVVPVNVQSSPVHLPVPDAYMRLCEIWLYKRFAARPKEPVYRDMFGTLPPITLTLEYQDIGDDWISQTYQISMNLVMFSFAEVKEAEAVRCMDAYIQARRLR